MFRRYVLPLIACVAFVLSTSLLVSAQNGPLRGKVTLKQADGTIVPAADAIVDIFRTDLSSGDFQVKTNKKGEFVHAGMALQGTFTVSVSMAGAAPYFQPNIRPGGEDIKIELVPGDGRRLTRAEIKTASAKTPGTPSSGESADDKAKREEMIKKNKEIEESNIRVKESNVIVDRTFKAGNEALRAKNYDLAIAQFDEGLAADPDHPGIPALLTNKTMALNARAVDKYNAAVKAPDDATRSAGIEASKKDWQAASEAGTKAVAMLKAAPAPTDPTAAAGAQRNMYFALMQKADAMRLFVVKVDQSKVDDGVVAYQEYIAAEPDPVKKSKAEHEMAKMLFDANAYEKAKPAYQKILAENPDDVEALQNMGLILYNLGFMKEAEGKKDEAKASYQEAANYLQRFADKSPDGQLKTEAQDVLKNLKEQQNVQAEKPTPTRRPTRRP
jgi:tetratricopeptide (TPR) repeat protein